MWCRSHLLTESGRYVRQPGPEVRPCRRTLLPEQSTEARCGTRRRACSEPRSRSARCRPVPRCNISARLTLVERNRLREGLSHIHRRRRRRAPRRGERAGARRARRRRVPRTGSRTTRPSARSGASSRRRPTSLAAVLGACARTQPLVAATALCHLRASYRAEVWSQLDAAERGSDPADAQPDPDTVGDPDRDVRARSTRPDRAPALTRSHAVPARRRGSVDRVASGTRVESSSCCTAANTMTAPNTWKPTSTAGIASKYCT